MFVYLASRYLALPTDIEDRYQINALPSAISPSSQSRWRELIAISNLVSLLLHTLICVQEPRLTWHYLLCCFRRRDSTNLRSKARSRRREEGGAGVGEEPYLGRE